MGADAFQAMLDQDAVLVLERDHVGDESERRQADRIEQEFAEFRGDALGAAGALGNRPGQFKCDPRAREFSERILRTGQARMDERRRTRQERAIDPLFHLVMVGDDEFESEFTGDFGFGQAGDAAVDAYDQRYLGADEVAEFRRVQPVAFGKAQRRVELHVRAQLRQQPHQDGGASHAVDVVVPVNADLPAFDDGLGDTFRCLVYAGQFLGSMQSLQRTLQETANATRIANAPVQEQLRHHRRHARGGRQTIGGEGVGGEEMPDLFRAGHVRHSQDATAYCRFRVFIRYVYGSWEMARANSFGVGLIHSRAFQHIEPTHFKARV